ncbi:hypothetical protein VitviT2T_011175 [Vitis vinifera]|uniref:MLO-like protein 1 n=2 Tax=Vitis vinifera TaxID=29760 RepID=A0ABY9C9Z9_VITVI|nr:hypothetical protein VitviT2T_011175 [Vitis vinifera]
MLSCKNEPNVKDHKDGYDPYLCGLQGKVPLISQPGAHPWHIFLLVLAVFHVLYGVGSMALGQAKMKKWKGWEMETTSFEYHCTNDGLQFFASVSKVDHLTMRHKFINARFAPNSKFDFHKYIKRSMEDDFKAVVGLSMPLWTSAIIFQLLNEFQIAKIMILYFLGWMGFMKILLMFHST